MTTPLIKKLNIKPAMRIMLINQPAGYQDALGDLPQGVVMVSQPRAPVDLVQVFCASMAQLKENLPRATASLKPGGLLWICWPKQSARVPTDLNRDILWRVMLQEKFKPVASVAISPMWAAMRFRQAR
jgi:hypothetical protein